MDIWRSSRPITSTGRHSHEPRLLYGQGVRKPNSRWDSDCTCSHPEIGLAAWTENDESVRLAVANTIVYKWLSRQEGTRTRWKQQITLLGWEAIVILRSTYGVVTQLSRVGGSNNWLRPQAGNQCDVMASAGSWSYLLIAHLRMRSCELRQVQCNTISLNSIERFKLITLADRAS